MHNFSMRPAKYFYDKPLPKYLDPKTVLIYRPHPVGIVKYTVLYRMYYVVIQTICAIRLDQCVDVFRINLTKKRKEKKAYK